MLDEILQEPDDKQECISNGIQWRKLEVVGPAGHAEINDIRMLINAQLPFAKSLCNALTKKTPFFLHISNQLLKPDATERAGNKIV